MLKPKVTAKIYEKKNKVKCMLRSKNNTELMVLAESVLEQVVKQLPKACRKEMFFAICETAWDNAGGEDDENS